MNACKFALTPLLSLTRVLLLALLTGLQPKLMDDLKRAKYADLLSSHIFVPVAIESTGVFGINTLSFVKCLGKRLSRHSGDPKSTSCLSIAVQRGNAISICGSTLTSANLDTS